MKISEQARQEVLDLERKARQAKRLLRAEDLVKFAESNPESSLHALIYDCEDDEAAQQYRVMRARQVLQYYVEDRSEPPRRIREFVSVPSDRTQTGGYRKTSDVLRNASKRKEMLAECLTRVKRLRQSYSYLKEADEFFDELDSFVDRWWSEFAIPTPEDAVTVA